MFNKFMTVQYQVLLYIWFTPPVVFAIFPYSRMVAVTSNCSAESLPCGTQPSCCTPGLQCNFLRGIPVCFNASETALSGFDTFPCADPYTIRCDAVLGVAGFCCPIGTICRVHGSSTAVQCVDALGKTQSSIPSATTGFIPPTTTATQEPVFSPSQAWNIEDSSSACTASKSLHTTSTLNATVSINYTGPSIMILTVTSPIGGLLSVLVDGFNTSSIIDTYGAPADPSVPTCYPVQVPPFVVVPPSFGSSNNHTVSLVYIGASPDAPGGSESNVQFDAFAIPEYDDSFNAPLKSYSDSLIMIVKGYPYYLTPIVFLTSRLVLSIIL